MTEVTQQNPMQKPAIRASEISTNCLSVEKWLWRIHSRSSNFHIIKMNVLYLTNNKIVKNVSQSVLFALIQQINKEKLMKDCYAHVDQYYVLL